MKFNTLLLSLLSLSSFNAYSAPDDEIPLHYHWTEYTGKECKGEYGQFRQERVLTTALLQNDANKPGVLGNYISHLDPRSLSDLANLKLFLNDSRIRDRLKNLKNSTKNAGDSFVLFRASTYGSSAQFIVLKKGVKFSDVAKIKTERTTCTLRSDAYDYLDSESLDIPNEMNNAAVLLDASLNNLDRGINRLENALYDLEVYKIGLDLVNAPDKQCGDTVISGSLLKGLKNANCFHSQNNLSKIVNARNANNALVLRLIDTTGNKLISEVVFDNNSNVLETKVIDDLLNQSCGLMIIGVMNQSPTRIIIGGEKETVVVWDLLKNNAILKNSNHIPSSNCSSLGVGKYYEANAFTLNPDGKSVQILSNGQMVTISL